MANGQTGFKPPRPVQSFPPLAGGLLAGQQLQRGGQTAMAGAAPQVPNPNAVPPPGAVDINARGRMPRGLMRFMNPGLMPGAGGPMGMVPGQPPPQENTFAPGALGGMQDPNAVAPVGLQQFQVGQPPAGIPMRNPVAMGGSFLGPPSQAPLVPQQFAPQFAGGIPAGQGGIPRNLLNLAMRRTGFMPQAFGQYGP